MHQLFKSHMVGIQSRWIRRVLLLTTFQIKREKNMMFSFFCILHFFLIESLTTYNSFNINESVV